MAEPIKNIDMTTEQMQRQNPDMDNDQKVRSERAFRLIFILGLIFVGTSISVLVTNIAAGGSLSDNLGATAAAFVGFLMLGGSFIARKGYILLVLSIVAVALYAATFFIMSQNQDVGLVASIMVTLPLVLLASQALPRKYVPPAIILFFIAGSTITLVDAFWVGERPILEPFVLQIIYVGLVLMIVVGLIMAIRQFPTYSLRTKLISGAIALVVITVFLTTIVINNFTRAILTEQLNEKFHVVGQAEASSVTELLTRQVEIIETLAVDSGLRTLLFGRNNAYGEDDEVNVANILAIDAQWETDTGSHEYLTNNTTAIILKEVQEKFPSHVEIFLTDRLGGLVGATNVTTDYYQADEAWWQAAYNDGQGKIYIGEPVFDESSGTLVINIAVPMFDVTTGIFTGVLRSSYDAGGLLTLLEGETEIGETGHLDLLFNETSLHFQDGSVQQESIEFDEALLSELQASSENVIGGVEGVQRLLTLVPLDSAGENPDIDELGWALMISQAEQEAFAAVKAQQQISTIIALVAIVVGTIVAVFVARFITGPINRLTETAVVIAEGNLDRQAKVETQDEIGTLATTFNRMTGQLRNFIDSLEERVADRTQALVTSTEVSRQLSTILNLDELASEVVNQIRDAYDYYYAQIYLYDEQKTHLHIVGGTGDAGQKMVATGHKLAYGQGLVGRAAATNEVVLIPDVAQDDTWLANELLPDTKAEAAIPIALDREVYGVLDVQHNVVGGLNEESVALLQSLANQVAIALQNARAFTQINQQATIIENTEAFIAMISLDGLVSFVNPTALSMLGYDSLDDVLNVSFAELQPETAEQFRSEIVPTVLETGVWHGESAVYHRDGHRIPIDQTISLIRDENNQPSALVTNAVDITERKQTETDLAERVKQLNLLNDIGRRTNLQPPLPEFLQWVAERMPQAMQYPEVCTVSVTLDGVVYGDEEALFHPRHIVEDLRLDNKSTGRICIAYTNAIYEFGDEESALIGNVGDRVSIYIENQRLLSQIQNQTEGLQAVAEIGTAVASINQEQELLQLVVTSTYARFGLYSTDIYLVDQAKVTAVLYASMGEAGEQASNRKEFFRIDNAQSNVALAIRSREPVIINDVEQVPNFVVNPLLPLTKSEMIIPLIAGENEALGALSLQANKTDYFTSQLGDIFNSLATQVAVALQNVRQYEQTQTALDELSALQRVITGEGWQSFIEAQGSGIKGYVASNHTVKPMSQKNGRRTNGDVVVPLTIRGTSIGKLGVKNTDYLSEEDRSLIEAVSRQVAEALERARLFEESEIARQQTNALYTGSEQVVRANSIDGVLDALAGSTAVARMERANFLFFNRPWGDEQPEEMTVVAAWEQNGDKPMVPVGTVYPLESYPIVHQLRRDEPLVVRNNEELHDENARLIFQELGIESVLAFPLVAGDQWIGIMTAHSQTDLRMSPDEVKQVTSLVSQAAVVAQTQKLFMETEARAEQEQLLRRVSERVYGAVDAESVLKTAVQEVSRSLGLEAFIYLDDENS